MTVTTLEEIDKKNTVSAQVTDIQANFALIQQFVDELCSGVPCTGDITDISQKNEITATIVDIQPNLGAIKSAISQLCDQISNLGGAPATSITFEQATAATVWGPIDHNLNRKPLVQVTDSAGCGVLGDVVHTTNNTLEIRFAVAISGEANLI